ncbi:MAG: S8 family serine peptidase [candidate division WOR-3 bacterium]|nr:MAG: S8 family serine peptidase [candidate division WOR-3 bacterium]
MFVLALGVLSFLGPGLKRTGPAQSFEPQPYRDSRVVRFANRLEIDTRFVPSAPAFETLSAGTYWLVNLAGPVRQEWLAELRQAGAHPVCYVAYQNVVCRIDRNLTAALLQNLEFVRWLGPVRPEAKLAPELTDAVDQLDLTLSLWPGESPGQTADFIQRIGGDVLRVNRSTLRFRLDAGQLPLVTGLPAVSWIQEHSCPLPVNSQVQWVLQTGWWPRTPPWNQGRRIWAKGLRGQGMTVGLFDSGILTGHDQFADPQFPLSRPGIFPEHRKIAAYKLYPRAAFGDAGAISYHGSAVAGTLAGDDSVCGNASKADGMAPDARIYFVDVGAADGRYVNDDDDYTEMLDSVRLSGGMPTPVRQVSGSFGDRAGLGYYRIQEATVDAVMWDDPSFFVVWAAGNDGGVRYRVGHPGCAKNVLTIGASLNGTACTRMSAISSRGPTRDGRIKPQLAAPGEDVTTVDGPGHNAYLSRDGTSFAAPAASGALLLLRQYLEQGWYPTGQPDTANRVDSPSSALMRSFAVVSGDRFILPETIPDNGYGWGRLNLDKILHFPDDSVGLTFVDETLGLATGELQGYQFRIDRREPLHVVLAWTDTAAAPEAAVAQVNDLDLQLVGPGLNVYQGNQLVQGWSRPNPPGRDERNNEEVCAVQQPPTGVWRILVHARSVFTDRQSYAIVARGGIEGVPGVGEKADKPAMLTLEAVTFVSGSRPLLFRASPGSNVRVMSSDGRVVFEGRVDAAGLLVWEGTGTQGGLLPAGMYFYRLTSGDGNTRAGRALVVR